MRTCKYISAIVSFYLAAVGAFAQSVSVSGVVKDENGAPLPGVTVVDKQSAGKGSVTDLEGRFSLRVPSDGFIEFSCLGYNTVLEQVNGRTNIEIQMKEEATGLDEVVVVAYGTAKKSDLTGAVATVDMRNIAETPATSIESALQGRVAGADFVSSTGEPGSSASIQIRGARSISAGNEPLIVVDGIIDAVQDLSEINPADIKSISVLKDVSSTSLYGSRGANGVILITTEASDSRNISSNLKVQLKAGVGFSQIAGSVDMMDASEFAEFCNMCAHYYADLKPQDESNYFYMDPSSLGRGTDWVRELSRTAYYQDYNLSLSGGGKNTKVSASFGYNNTQGVIIGSGFQRYSARVNIEHQPFKWIKLGFWTSYTLRDTDRTNASITGTNNTAAIYLSPTLNIHDTWNTFGSEYSSGGAVFNNPYLSAKNQTNELRQTNLSLTPWIRLFFGKAGTFLTKFTYGNFQDRTFYYSPSYLPVATRMLRGGTAWRSRNERFSYLSENTYNFKKIWKRRHTLDLMGGFTAEYRGNNYDYMYGQGYMDDSVTYKNMAGLLDPRNYTIRSNETIKTKLSVLARANYDYRKKYFLTLTMRADGASNFADNRKWGAFPAVAFRWAVNKEKFLRGQRWINDFSLRASAGRSGNDAISPYLSIPTLTSDRTVWIFGDYQPIAYFDARLANSNLTWETTDAFNLGLNFSAFRERINLEVDTYMSRTHDLLLSMKTNRTTGFDSYFNNYGTTENRGVELSLSTRNIAKRRFSWLTTFTIAHNEQKVIDAGEGDRIIPTYSNPRNSTQPMYGYRNGYSVNSLWGYQYAGVWHNQEEIDRNKISNTYAGNAVPQLGAPKFVDINNDGLLDQNDLVWLGTSDPVVYGGLQNTFTWRNITLRAYFNYSLGGKIYNISELWVGSGSRAYNKYRYLLDSWHPVRNPDSDIPRAGLEDLVASDRILHDASYIRFKELSLSYRFNMPRKVKWCKSVNIGVSGTNLWLWKRYNGFDPDVSTESGARRVDNASFPRPRTFMFNIQLSY